MPIPLKVRVATANCGNDGPGLDALEKILQLLEKDNLDCLILSGQELNFHTFTSQFYQQFANSQYQLVPLGWMHTHTKLNQLFSTHTGIGGFVIAKKGIQIEPLELINSRRSDRLRFTKRFNKGGQISKFRIGRNGDSFLYHHISGHLDSNYREQAAYDWYKLYTNYAHSKIESWEGLVAITPDFLSCGMDANTRNIINDTRVVNPWIESHINTKVLRLAPLGNHFFSAENTYYSHIKDTESAMDRKRKGYVRAGSLDVVSILDPFNQRDVFKINNDESVVIPSDPTSSRRDHSIIISPIIQMTQENEFNRVKQFLGAQVKNFSKDLSELIISMTDTPQSRQQLIDCYNSFLSKTGLLSQVIDETIAELTQHPRLNTNTK